MTKSKIKTTTTVTKAKPKAKIVKLSIGPKSADSLVGYGTGRRKNAIARVWVTPGKGQIVVNQKDVDLYFCRDTHKRTLILPFVATKTTGQYDIFCTVKGGGSSGQAGAILHGVARALDKIAPEFHQALRKTGLLTRDSRVVERKKYGKHKARKSTQFSKR